jgi:hypothetical protein
MARNPSRSDVLNCGTLIGRYRISGAADITRSVAGPVRLCATPCAGITALRQPTNLRFEIVRAAVIESPSPCDLRSRLPSLKSPLLAEQACDGGRIGSTHFLRSVRTNKQRRIPGNSTIHTPTCGRELPRHRQKLLADSGSELNLLVCELTPGQRANVLNPFLVLFL